MADELPDLPPQPLPGYAPRLCAGGPAHYARSDPEAEGIVWRCLICDQAWRTNGEPV